MLHLYAYTTNTSQENAIIVSKNMKDYKKHVRVAIPGTDCRRNFSITTYGSKELCVMAATEFETYGDRVISDFDQLARKPNQRKALLDAQGVGADCNKKAIRVQRIALCNSLSMGYSTLMENEIISNVWKKHLSHEVLPKASVTYSGSTSQFVVDFLGEKQQLQQSFKSMKLAADWARGMHAADKDRLVGTYGWRGSR